MQKIQTNKEKLTACKRVLEQIRIFFERRSLQEQLMIVSLHLWYSSKSPMSAIFTAAVAPSVCWKQYFFGQCSSPRIIMRMTIRSTPPRFWTPWCIVMLVAYCFLHLFCPQVTCGQPCGQFIPLALDNVSVFAHSSWDGVLVESVRCSKYIMKTSKDLSTC